MNNVLLFLLLLLVNLGCTSEDQFKEVRYTDLNLKETTKTSLNEIFLASNVSLLLALCACRDVAAISIKY